MGVHNLKGKISDSKSDNGGSIPSERMESKFDHSPWKKCLMCQGTLRRIREAVWRCTICHIQIIADEKDMRLK